jgi:TPR repeat protein
VDESRDSLDLGSRAREQVVRIAREAIVNAVWHGFARHIEVVLDGRGPRWLLRVIDDGCGIDEQAPPSTGGFGLPTMPDRAENLGGHLIARRRPAGGSELEVSLAVPVDDRGSVAGAFDLGVMLEQDADFESALQVYRRADERGHAAAAVNLGVLLERSGDLAGAERAYRRADKRRDANGTFNLGALLEERGDLAGAEEAYARADGRGHAAAACNLGALLAEQGRLAVAEAAFRRAADRGDASGASNLAALLDVGTDAVVSGAAGAGARANFRRPDRLTLARRKRGSAENLDGATRARGRGFPIVSRRLALVGGLPVAAFATAFALGATTRTQPTLPGRPAAAASVNWPAVTVAEAVPVPAPPALNLSPSRPVRHRAAPASAASTAPAKVASAPTVPAAGAPGSSTYQTSATPVTSSSGTAGTSVGAGSTVSPSSPVVAAGGSSGSSSSPTPSHVSPAPSPVVTASGGG